MTSAKVIVDFMLFAERLKTVMRHSYTSAGRQESVAEHCWMNCLLAIAVVGAVDLEVDALRVLKMLVVHDLAEIVTGDIPTFEKLGSTHAYEADEAAALRQITEGLPEALRDEIVGLSEEYHAHQTNEGKVAYAVDKAEALIQHLAAPLATWDQNDYAYQTDFQGPRRLLFEVDPFLRALKDEIDRATMAKINAGV